MYPSASGGKRQGCSYRATLKLKPGHFDKAIKTPGTSKSVGRVFISICSWWDARDGVDSHRKVRERGDEAG